MIISTDVRIEIEKQLNLKIDFFNQIQSKKIIFKRFDYNSLHFSGMYNGIIIITISNIEIKIPIYFSNLYEIMDDFSKNLNLYLQNKKD